MLADAADLEVLAPGAAVAVALGDLLRGQETANFKQVASFAAPKNRTIYIYEFPANYNDVPPLSLSGAGNGQQ